ncbi:unnamed protein product [Diatraea saccharalis]|uniref:Uncharacterized protein n=1 Tax=Diatraea saccharalis TaxID=40085 RepID=A0A9N9R5A9_9NEOP|nr:unnamed protein product [Diatraea saccharalis]
MNPKHLIPVLLLLEEEDDSDIEDLVLLYYITLLKKRRRRQRTLAYKSRLARILFSELHTKMESDNEKNKKPKKKKTTKVDMNSTAYLRQKEKAKSRKLKYLMNLTEEQKEKKRAKDREYHHRKKAESKRKSIEDMSEGEKGKQRTLWREYSKKYRQNKKSKGRTACSTENEKNENSMQTSTTMETENENSENLQMSTTTETVYSRSPKTDEASPAAGPSNTTNHVTNDETVYIKKEADDMNTDAIYLNDKIEIKIEPIDDVEVTRENDPLQESTQEYDVPIKNEYDDSIEEEDETLNVNSTVVNIKNEFKNSNSNQI